MFKIGAMFSDIDSKIELNQQMNKLLEKMGEKIFKQWFINFEFPTDQGNYKSSGGKFAYNEEIDKELPLGWNVKPLEKVAEDKKGFSYKGTEKSEFGGDYIFITLNNIIQGGGFQPRFSSISSNRLKERHFLSESDLVIANTHFGVGGSNIARLLGCPAIVYFSRDYQKQTGVFSHHITRIIPFNPNMKYFLYFLLKITQKETSLFYRTGTSVAGLDIENFMTKKQLTEPPEPILKNLI